MNLTNSEVQTYRFPGTRGRPDKFVSESGLYKLLFQSRKPDAYALQDRVTGTVLPAIRKDGEARNGRTTSIITKHQRKSHVSHGSSRCI